MIVLVEKQTREKHAKKGTYMAQEKKLVVNWEELANHLLDMAIESWSPNEVMESLYASGFSEELLIYLGFGSEEVEEMVKENAKTKLDDSQDAPYQAHKDAKVE
jgi:hypothetical protein